MRLLVLPGLHLSRRQHVALGLLIEPAVAAHIELVTESKIPLIVRLQLDSVQSSLGLLLRHLLVLQQVLLRRMPTVHPEIVGLRSSLADLSVHGLVLRRQLVVDRLLHGRSLLLAGVHDAAVSHRIQETVVGDGQLYVVVVLDDGGWLQRRVLLPLENLLLSSLAVGLVESVQFEGTAVVD